MNKELFVSSTPHETKVGLVEDDLLAEVYLERENEYTLAGSIYKGRVTRVLPGMQSAFVDIGLERDAFLYVSDFLDLEEHDEDLTDTVPANRGVQDMRPQAVSSQPVAITEGAETEGTFEADRLSEPEEPGESTELQPAAPTGAHESGSDGDGRERGNWRGRRRRRGGRRDGRDRGSDSRFSRPSPEGSSAPPQSSRPRESGRTQQSGPPAGYQPILLPGESISKYRGMSSPAPTASEESAAEHVQTDFSDEPSPAPLTAVFPGDEPIFAGSNFNSEESEESIVVRDSVQNSPSLAPEAESSESPEEFVSSASTSIEWNREFRQPEPRETHSSVSEPAEVEERIVEVSEESEAAAIREDAEPARSRRHEAPAFAAPGTLEEETIDEEEADAVRYVDSSDDGYDEFEEETRAAGQAAEVRATVDEIHMASLADAGISPASPGESDEDSEELELEEAQAEAEALLDAEARGNGTEDARAEVRASSGTAGYTQRAPRPRPGWERRGGGRRGGGRRFPRRQSQDVPKISDLLKEGQEILVQIAKEPIGKKGARITSHIALPGRFLVYMPTVNHTGVSRKIASDEERQRLKRIVMSERENGHGGFIVRTAAQNASEDELRADIRFLKGLWNDIKNRAENSKPPALIYHDLNVVERVLRDQVTSDFSVIWVDTEPEYERILRFFNRFQPGLVKRVKLYTKETPLFEQFGLAEEMNKALKSKVWLKSGGYIVINQTEALVAIDINTGKYVGKTSRLEDTIVKTNVDAIKEIVRQIRLRDLGGIIIIDFIDMDERRNRQRVMQALEEELRHDRAPSKVLQFNDFGLVAITRKRVKQSLERTIGAPCPYCQSTGYVKSVTTVCNEIYVEMRKIAKHLEREDVMLRVNPDVAKELKTSNARLLNEMEELTKRTIIVKSDPTLHQEQFDIN
ncbi:MAG TPA: Rne/Rng family ribonuclease [Candidatus Binatia bacterium]|nr:Rne/Rng family ribonuclease [Candidatus Binatia bacterium]